MWCAQLGHLPSVLSFVCMLVCFQTWMSPFHLIISQWLWALNVAPTQLHPNTWKSIQAFCLIYDVFRLSPTPSTFLSYYTSHPTKLALWHSLVGRLGNVLFGSFTTSYKNFKEKFLKVFVRPEGMIICLFSVNFGLFSLLG